MNNEKIKKLVGTSCLAAIIVVIQLVVGVLYPGVVGINLSLIPLVVGAIIYGPKVGFILGLILGAMTLCDKTTTMFLNISVVGTIITCLVKSSVAGYVAGIVFKAFENKRFILGIALASIVAPIINTGLFTISSVFIYHDFISNLAVESDMNFISFYFLVFIGFNFLIEMAVNVILIPTIVYVYRIAKNHFKTSK